MEINVNGNVTINLEAEKVNTEQSSNPDIEVVKECAFQLDPEATLNELLEVLASNPEVLASAVNEAADKALTDKQWEVYVMSYEEGLSEYEIADQLSITQKAVHCRLEGVRKKAKKIF